MNAKFDGAWDIRLRDGTRGDSVAAGARVRAFEGKLVLCPDLVSQRDPALP